jgi:hypothetical protein
MVQLFALNLAWLAPLLIVAGVVVYLSKRNERAGQIGKIILGLGVMIIALQLIGDATRPLTEAAGVRVLFAELSGDLLLDVLIGARWRLPRIQPRLCSCRQRWRQPSVPARLRCRSLAPISAAEQRADDWKSDPSPPRAPGELIFEPRALLALSRCRS